MTTSTVTQCDLCPAITEHFLNFHRIRLFIAPPSGTPASSDDRRAIDERVELEATLCPKCAEPMVTLQRAILDLGKADTAGGWRAKRLNERILAAIKKAE